MRRKVSRITGIAVAFALSGAVACVTVNIYFPAPEVRQAAEEIVDETWGNRADPAPRSRLDGYALPRFAAMLLEPSTAHAAEPDVNISTPAIRSIKESIKARAGELRPFLGSGAVGIGRDGMLVARSIEGLDLAGKARVKRLVEAENKDRMQLYRELAAANGYGSERVPDIQKIFAETWIGKAERGWWVQEGGAWRQK